MITRILPLHRRDTNNRYTAWPQLIRKSPAFDAALIFIFVARRLDEKAHQWRMASSGMLRRVVLVRTDISEEFSASIIRVTRICELGT
jgi:hypothetical protein